MAKDGNYDNKAMVKDALIHAIYAHINDSDILKVCGLGNATKRQDGLTHLIRDAVKSSEIAVLNGEPHIYSPKTGLYHLFSWSEISDAIYEAMLKKRVPDGNYGKIDAIARRCMLSILDRQSDFDPTIVVMGNGVYDTKDHTLYPYDPKFIANSGVKYKYKPNDYPHLWHTFLNEVLPNKEMQDLLQEVVAATFVDRNAAKIETCTILLGNGSNGKSVVFETVSALLGDENVSNFSISDLINASKRDICVAMCNGKRLNYCSEIRTREISAANADAFKALVSGEHVMARALYKNFFVAKNIPMLMANANALPTLNDQSHALQRRFIVIPFKAYIPDEKQDKELAVKLRHELPGIFNWAMEGLKRLASNSYKITVPVECRQLISERMKDSCTLMSYLDHMQYYCEMYPQCVQEEIYLNSVELYNSYYDWCVEKRLNYYGKKEFGEKMIELKYERVRRNSGYFYVVYRVRTREDILKSNLDLAAAMQKQYGFATIKAIEDAGRKKVRGIVDTERYLGLPEGIVTKMMMNGFLEGTYEKSHGELIFDVLGVQQALAQNGFFESIKYKGDKKVLRDAVHAVTNICKAFNEKMTMLGYPIRKFSSSMSMKPEDNGCVIVPVDWMFTEDKARAVMRAQKDGEKLK